MSAFVTVCLRAIPIVLLSQVRLPELIHDWLGFVPAAIMASIIMAELMAKPALTSGGWSISLIAALATLAVGMLSRSLFLTVLAGIAAYVALQIILP